LILYFGHLLKFIYLIVVYLSDSLTLTFLTLTIVLTYHSLTRIQLFHLQASDSYTSYKQATSMLHARVWPYCSVFWLTWNDE